MNKLTITARNLLIITARCFLPAMLILLLTMNVSAQKQDVSAADGKTPLALQPGAPAGSYALSGFDNINYYNGNLNFHLPLLGIGGRGSAQMTMMLGIDSKGWHVKHHEVEIPPVECGNGEGVRCVDSGGYGAVNTPEPNLPTPKPGLGAGILFGRSTGTGSNNCNKQGITSYSKSLTRLTFITPDGTEYELRDHRYAGLPQTVSGGPCNGNAVAVSRGTVFESADGNAATFVSDYQIRDKAYVGPQTTQYTYPSGYLMLKDGMRYRIDNGNVTWMRDRNGNLLTFTYSINQMEIRDSLNRQVTLQTVNDGGLYGLCTRITYRGFGGAERIIRISYKSLSQALRTGFTAKTYQGLFPELYQANNTLNSNVTHNPTVVSAVWLPDDRSYKFYYNSYGELARVDLPTGGRVEYDYTSGSGCIDDLGSNCTDQNSNTLEIYRRVTTKRVYKEGGTLESKTTISDAVATHLCQMCTTLPQSIVTVHHLDGTNHKVVREKHFYFGDPIESLYGSPTGYPAWNESREFKTEIHDVSSTDANPKVLRQVENTWEQGAPLPQWIADYNNDDLVPGYNVRLKEVVTTLKDTGNTPKKLSKQTFKYDQYNNQTDVYEYDYGDEVVGLFRRRTHIEYLATNSVNNLDYDTLPLSLTNSSTSNPEQPYSPNECQECDPGPGSPPVAEAGGPYTGTTDVYVNFNGSGSTDDVEVITYRWNFGDGTTAMGANVAHDYAQAGIYTVVLTVWDEDGHSDADVTTVTINPPPTPAPQPNPAVEATIHIRNLPLQQWVSSDEEGTQRKAVTTYEYDQYTGIKHAGLLTRPNISGLDAGFALNTKKTRGNVTAISRRLIQNNNSREITTYQQYDVAGNIVKAIDANGSATQFDFADRLGTPNDNEARSNTSPQWLTQHNNMSYAFATKVTLPTVGTTEAQVTYTQYDYYLGKPVNVEDANGTVYSGYYNDALDRPTRLISAYGNTALRRQTTFSYDDANRTITTTSDQTAYNDNLLKSQVVYDGLGRTIKTITYEEWVNLLPDKQKLIEVDQEYDALGRVKKVSNPYRPNLHELVRNTETFYDELGRVTRVKSPTDQPDVTADVTTNYSGNTVTVRDQKQRDRKSMTDALGRLVEVVEDPGGREYQTSYEYDVLDNLVQVNQGSQTPRTFTYDSLKRLTQAFNPESGWVEYRYDDNGNLLEKKDARQLNSTTKVTTTYAYDDLNRMTSKTYNDGTPNVKYFYDDQATPSDSTFDRGDFWKGHLIAVTYGAAGSRTGTYYAYDALGRITKSVQQTDVRQPGATQPDVQPFEVKYVYNRADALVSETYPSGRVVKTTYDGAGRVSKVTGQRPNDTVAKPYADMFGYASHGAVSKVKLGNNLWEHTSFNPRLQPTEIGLGISEKDSSTLKLNYNYGTTDNNGNLLSQTITMPVPPAATNQLPTTLTLTQTYSYDVLNRLESAQEKRGTSVVWKQGYQYDRYGNRRINAAQTTSTLVGANPVIDEATNRINATGYSYDEAGNMTGDPGHSYQYDAENRMKTFDAGTDHVTTYTYDGEGRRIRKVIGIGTLASASTYIYDVDGKLIAESGTNTAGSEIGVRYLTADYLGSTRVVTDGGKIVKARYDYLPFGEQITSNYGGRDTIPGYATNDQTRQKFTSKERDSETGLDYFGERYYSGIQGRFTTVDPLMASAKASDPQTWSRYTYVLNNPLRYVDPTGEDADSANQDPIIKFVKFGTLKILGKTLTVYVPANQSKEQKEKQFNQFVAAADSINANASKLTKEEKATIGTITALVALPVGMEYGQTFSAQGIDNVMVDGNWTEGIDTSSGTVFFTAGRLEGQTPAQTASDIGHEGKHKRDYDTRTGAEAPGALSRLGPRGASNLSERRADQFQMSLYRKLAGLKPRQDDDFTRGLKEDIKKPHKGAAIY